MVENLDAAQQATIAAARKKAIDKAIVEFDKIDADKNQNIDREEVTKMFSAAFTASDNNEAALNEKINQLFDTFDSNKDGVISKDEWVTFFGEVFDKVLTEGLIAGQWSSVQPHACPYTRSTNHWV